jgi:ADP-ribose pyrophosphatase YjhB (NUDIX family)
MVPLLCDLNPRKYHQPRRAVPAGVVRARVSGRQEREGASSHRRRTREEPILRLERKQDIPFTATEPYRFCPADGTKLVTRNSESGGAACPTCGRSWYRSSSPAVGAAIVRGGRALVTVRGIEPEKGRLDLPGGFVEVGEHPRDALAREAREELGVEVEVEERPMLLAVHTYGPDGEYVLAIGFRVRIVSGEPNPADDVAEIRWVSEDEIDALDFAWEHDRRIARRALEDG